MIGAEVKRRRRSRGAAGRIVDVVEPVPAHLVISWRTPSGWLAWCFGRDEAHEPGPTASPGELDEHSGSATRPAPHTHSRVQRRDAAVYFAVLRGALVALVAADRSENVLAWSLVVSQDQHINAV